MYRLPDETKLTLESSELTIMYNAGVLVKSLEPGSYRLEIKLVQGGDVLDTYIHEFDMPYPVTRLVHVFGTEEPIEGLVFRQTFPESEEPLTATEIPNPGKGYVTYAVDIIPDRCFTMESDNYDFSVGNKLCASESREFIVHASDATDYSVRLSLFYAFIDEEEGILSGYLLPNMNGMYMLTMDLYDQNENAHACYMNGEIEYMFECELPDEPDYLWIDMKIGGMVVPANIVIPLTDINLPGEMTIVDENEHLDLIDPLIEFEDVADENEFAFYKITPTQEDFLPTGMRYIPVGGESNSIDLDLIEAVGFNDRNVAIQLVDTDGNLHAKTAVFPLIDKMSKQEGRVDYETKYDMEWIESDSPEDASFRDDDLTAGDRSGKVTWSLPEIGEIDLIAYDLYFYSDTDPDQVKIQGEARVYVIQGLTQTFEYQLENVPEWADYLEVVPLLRDMVQRRDLMLD